MDSVRVGVVDVQYGPDAGATAALAVYGEVRCGTLVHDRVVNVEQVAAYEPGAFVKRELPALRAVVQDADALSQMVIDGYVDLDPDGRDGLGAHVQRAFGVPVIGIAKTLFRPATHAVRVYRGGATKPLYVTARGVDVTTAAQQVQEMAGTFRLPDAVRYVDALARRRFRGMST